MVGLVQLTASHGVGASFRDIAALEIYDFLVAHVDAVAVDRYVRIADCDGVELRSSYRAENVVAVGVFGDGNVRTVFKRDYLAAGNLFGSRVIDFQIPLPAGFCVGDTGVELSFVYSVIRVDAVGDVLDGDFIRTVAQCDTGL